MANSISEHFLFNSTMTGHCGDDSYLAFSQGRFDNWCVYHVSNNNVHAVKDREVFALLAKYSNNSARFKLYAHFVSIFDTTTATLNRSVISKIRSVAKDYDNVSEISFILLFLYAGMVAEENKKKAILKKFIKRLGVHQVLIEGMAPELAANYSRGKNWRELQSECIARGFYNKSENIRLTA